MCRSVLQYVAVCCSVLQCVVVCRSVSQCVAVSLKCVAVSPLMETSLPSVLCVLQCATVCCRVLQCVVVCCSVLQCVAVCCSVFEVCCS